MIIQKVLPFTDSLLEKTVRRGSIAIDATVGNGYDTKKLASLVGSRGHVFGFDIQSTAIKNTHQLLESHNLRKQVTLFKSGHEHFTNHVPSTFQGKIQAAIFNLGYLPGGHQHIVTQPETTIAAIEQILPYLATQGILILVIYHGHDAGKKEKSALLTYVRTLPHYEYYVLQYEFINQSNDAPLVVVIEKRKQMNR